MAGFGDGKPFGPWIEEHIRRKAALDHPGDSLVQALEGARISLAGGVTTVADCCYAGTVAAAAIDTGLRAIVYLEGFSAWGDLRERMGDALDMLPADPLVTPGLVAARAVHRHPGRLRGDDRGGPRAGIADRHPPARIRPRDAAPGGVRASAGARHRGHPRRVHERRRHRAGGPAGCAGDPLSPVKRAAWLRHRARPRAVGGGHPGGPGHRLARLGDGVRHVGGDAGRGDDGAGPRRPRRCAHRDTGTANGHAGRSRGDRAPIRSDR